MRKLFVVLSLILLVACATSSQIPSEDLTKAETVLKHVVRRGDDGLLHIVSLCGGADFIANREVQPGIIIRDVILSDDGQVMIMLFDGVSRDGEKRPLAKVGKFVSEYDERGCPLYSWRSGPIKSHDLAYSIIKEYNAQ